MQIFSFSASMLFKISISSGKLFLWTYLRISLLATCISLTEIGVAIFVFLWSLGFLRQLPAFRRFSLYCKTQAINFFNLCHEVEGSLARQMFLRLHLLFDHWCCCVKPMDKGRALLLPILSQRFIQGVKHFGRFSIDHSFTVYPVYSVVAKKLSRKSCRRVSNTELFLEVKK